MEFQFNCIHCSKPILVDTSNIGILIGCPHCQTNLYVPDKTVEEHDVFRPFSDDELMNCISHFPHDVIRQILQVEKNQFSWPLEIFAILIDSTLKNHFPAKNYEPSGGTIFLSTSKGKRNFIAKQIEYFKIIGKISHAVNQSFRVAVENYDIQAMVNFIDSFAINLEELHKFFVNLETLGYPSKESFQYLIHLLVGWEEEFSYSINLVVAALRDRAKKDPENANLCPVQVSLTPLSSYEFNDILFEFKTSP